MRADRWGVYCGEFDARGHDSKKDQGVVWVRGAFLVV